MQKQPLMEQLNTNIDQLVKLRLIIETGIVREVDFTTAERSVASLMLVGCDYLIENLSVLRAAIALK